jgi:hypothetical protein
MDTWLGLFTSPPSIAYILNWSLSRAWKEKLAPKGTGEPFLDIRPSHFSKNEHVLEAVRFLADDRGLLVSKLGLTFDATETLGSHRSKVSHFHLLKFSADLT